MRTPSLSAPIARNLQAVLIAWVGLATVAALPARAASSIPAAASAPAEGVPVEVVAELARRPGNVAVTPEGRVLFSQHPLDAPEFKVLEWMPGGTPRPFPNAEWSRDLLQAVIGLRAGRDGIVWILDMGSRERAPRLIGWNLQRDALHREITIPASATKPNSFLQDFALDLDHGMAYIADLGRGDLVGKSEPALIAVDLRTGVSRRLLDSHASFAPQSAVRIDGQTLRSRGPDGRVGDLMLGLDSISIDPDNTWLYYGSVGGRQLWRVPAAALADATLSDTALAARIERYSEKRSSDGISAGRDGQVYITDVEAHAIGLAGPQGYRVVARDPAKLQWPDGLAFGPDGWLYATVNQLHRHPALNGGQEGGQPPYYIVRLRPPVPGAIGR